MDYLIIRNILFFDFALLEKFSQGKTPQAQKSAKYADAGRSDSLSWLYGPQNERTGVLT